MSLITKYLKVRSRTEQICSPLEIEDYVVQPIIDVSPPKWHLGHTTWFFEQFLLQQFHTNYTVYDADFSFVFNSYYETVGKRVVRANRGNLSRPSVQKVYEYRKHVDAAMKQLLESDLSKEANELFLIGINHEQQHQELLITDIKYILGNNPLLPEYGPFKEFSAEPNTQEWIDVKAGLYEIGHQGEGFCYDNELGRHQVYLNDFSISNRLVTKGEYIEFIESDAYKTFSLWHAEAWDWIQNNDISAPMYWHQIDGVWHEYTMQGLQKVQPEAAVCHISYYEAFAYASWKGMRLPTEFEWETAQNKFSWGQRWEWTESAYLPYPNYTKAPGAIGEYNGKFMVNQKVLRGSSVATSEKHSRLSYRNFFHPNLRS